jgi:hypothetical protein
LFQWIPFEFLFPQPFQNIPKGSKIMTRDFVPSGHVSAPEEPVVSEAFDLIIQSNDPPPLSEQDPRIEELQEELKKLKGQIIVALDKVKRASDREDYLLQLISRTSEPVM